MALIVFTSAPGSPGVTTTTLALALTWPRDVLLADCDRDPAQTLLAGYLRGMDSGGRGLTALAGAHREDRSIPDELLHHTLPLAEGDSTDRRFLPGFAQPAAVRLFDTVWGPLAEAFETLDERGMDVLVDAGRIGAHGLPSQLLASADLVLALTRSTLRGLAALRLHLPTLRDQLARLPVEVPLGLGVVGPGKPYAPKEIEGQFAVPTWLEFPLEARAAAVLLEGEREPRKFADHHFVGRARAQAKHLADRIRGLRASKEALVAHV